MRSSAIAVLAVVIAGPQAAPAADGMKAATPLGAEILAFEGALTEKAVPGWAAQRGTWARLVSASNDPKVLATCVLTLEQSLAWEAVESTWKARRSAWASEAGRAASMSAAAKLLLDLESHTRWSAVSEAWKKDRDGWVRRVSAIAPATPAQAAPAVAPAASGAIPLETVSDPAMGYRISIPKGAKVLNKTSMQHTYSLLFPGPMNEINVSLATVGEDSLANAVNMIQMGGAGEILEKSQLGPGQYDIVALSPPRWQEVHAYRRKGGVKIRAKCSGPASHVALLKEICRSLEIVK